MCFFARKNCTKDEIKDYVENTFHYDVNSTFEKISQNYNWNATCQQTVPQAIISFLYSNDYEDSIRNAISLGSDSDTIACMTGAISEAYWGVPIELVKKAYEFLPVELSNLVEKFEKTFGNNILL